MNEMESRAALLSYVRRLTGSGWLVGTSGNMSLRCGEEGFLITPSSIDYQIMEEKDLFLIRQNGEAVPGTGRPTSSLAFHRRLMKERPDINVIIHTHAPYATAASTVTKSVPAVTFPALIYLGGDIPVAPFADNGSEEEAANIAAALGTSHQACLMQNHGAVAVGKDLADAWMNMSHLEECCQVWILAKSTGLTPSSL